MKKDTAFAIYSFMCNALSPEKAVIWSLLHAHDIGVGLSVEHFTYASYRRWFRVCADVRAHGEALTEDAFYLRSQALGMTFDARERRALRRLFRLRPPARILDNAEVFAQALSDRARGQRVHIERLIN